MRKQNKQVDEKEEGAAWLATYSDMVTVLFAFFVLMFAISNVDAQKFALLAAGLSKDGITAEQFIQIQEKYGMDGVGDPDPTDIKYPGPEDDPNQPTEPPIESSATEPSETTESTTEATTEEDDQGGLGEENGVIDQLYSLILNYIRENDLGGSVSAEYESDKILLTVSNDIWFVSGSAQISNAMMENAAILARLLSDTQNEEHPFEIIIVGHTDNVPMNTARYPSNWDLSVDRAVQFLRVLINESGLSTKYFSARGYGEEAPIADNDTDEGKQKNRRVELLISQTKS